MDGGTLASVRKKYRLFRRWLNTRNGEDYLEYIKARNKARKECRKAQRNLEKKLAKEAKTNPNGVKKMSRGIGQLTARSLNMSLWGFMPNPVVPDFLPFPLEMTG